MGRMGRSSPRWADPCVPVKLFMARLGCVGSVPAARSIAAARFAAEIGGASDCSRRPSSLYFPTPNGVFGASSASASPLLRLARALALVALALVDVRLRGGTPGGPPPPPSAVSPPTAVGPPGLEPRDDPLERFFSLAIAVMVVVVVVVVVMPVMPVATVLAVVAVVFVRVYTPN